MGKAGILYNINNFFFGLPHFKFGNYNSKLSENFFNEMIASAIKRAADEQ